MLKRRRGREGSRGATRRQRGKKAIVEVLQPQSDPSVNPSMSVIAPKPASVRLSLLYAPLPSGPLTHDALAPSTGGKRSAIVLDVAHPQGFQVSPAAAPAPSHSQAPGSLMVCVV